MFQVPSFPAAKIAKAVKECGCRETAGRTIAFRCFGERSRYAARLVTTRLERPMIFVYDAETTEGDSSAPSIVRQFEV
jgi:hypothetical protein